MNHKNLVENYWLNGITLERISTTAHLPPQSTPLGQAKLIYSLSSLPTGNLKNL